MVNRELLTPQSVPHVQSQILVLLATQSAPLILNPEDTITRGTEIISFPQGVMAQLTHERGWVDVWQEQELDNGGFSRLAVRVLGRNVTMLTQAFVFPPGEEMVQA